MFYFLVPTSLYWEIKLIMAYRPFFKETQYSLSVSKIILLVAHKLFWIFSANANGTQIIEKLNLHTMQK